MLLFRPMAPQEWAVHGVGVGTFKRIPSWTQPLRRWLTSHLVMSSIWGYFPAPPLKKGVSSATITIPCLPGLKIDFFTSALLESLPFLIFQNMPRGASLLPLTWLQWYNFFPFSGLRFNSLMCPWNMGSASPRRHRTPHW